MKDRIKTLETENTHLKRVASEIASDTIDDCASEFTNEKRNLEKTNRDLEHESLVADNILNDVRQSNDKSIASAKRLETLLAKEGGARMSLEHELEEARMQIDELESCSSFREHHSQELTHELKKLQGKLKVLKPRKKFAECGQCQKRRRIAEAKDLCKQASEVLDKNAELKVEFTVEGIGGATFHLRTDEDDHSDEEHTFEPDYLSRLATALIPSFVRECERCSKSKLNIESVGVRTVRKRNLIFR